MKWRATVSSPAFMAIIIACRPTRSLMYWPDIVANLSLHMLSYECNTYLNAGLYWDTNIVLGHRNFILTLLRFRGTNPRPFNRAPKKMLVFQYVVWDFFRKKCIYFQIHVSLVYRSMYKHWPILIWIFIFGFQFHIWSHIKIAHSCYWKTHTDVY